MTSTPLRNVDVDLTAPVEDWPFEALATVLDRGTVDEWRRVVAAIRSQPWGTVARNTETIIGWGERYGVDALLEEAIRRARRDFQVAARRKHGQRLRRLRLSAGLTLRELGAATGITAANLSKYENGLMSPTLDTVERIEQALAVQQPRAIEGDGADAAAIAP